MKRKNILLLMLIIFGGIFVFNLAFAQEIIPGANNSDNTVKCSDPATAASHKYECGNYEVNDLVRVGINITNFILGITGSLALLFFVYGGIMFLISGGSQERVTKGKTIITNAVIGIVLVFTSYMIIQFAMKAMGLEWNGGSGVPAPINEPAVPVTTAETNAFWVE